VGGKNCCWQLHDGHNGRFAGLGSKIGPKPPPRYHLNSHQELLIGVIKTWTFVLSVLAASDSVLASEEKASEK